jgi:hypothetical protein
MNEQQEKKVTNQHRRTFLMVSATGAVAFLVGKFFGNGDGLHFGKKEPEESLIAQKDFNNFVLTETENEMSLLDRFGNKLVVIEKDTLSDE